MQYETSAIAVRKDRVAKENVEENAILFTDSISSYSHFDIVVECHLTKSSEETTTTELI